MQNVILKGRDNPVVISFTFDRGDFQELGLDTFSRIQVTIGDVTLNTLDNPTQVYVQDQTDLYLKLDNEDISSGSYLPEVVGFSNVYTKGYELTGKCKPILGYLEVKDC